jgi:uncharacterized protein YllA (UPF0747 family)
MNRFVLDWLAGDERFLRRGPGERSATAPTERGALARALEASNASWGNDAAAPSIAAWEQGESATLIAGQQVGFAGGPLYTLAKLATLVRMKRELEKGGRRATAFFWLATEDHDLAEVATLNVPVSFLETVGEENGQKDLACIRAAASGRERRVVGPLPIPEELRAAFVDLFRMPRPSWLRPGISFRDSFAELIVSLFPGEVVLVDALLPELRRLGAPLLTAIAEGRAEIQQRLAARAAELEAAGYRPQVTARDGDEYTLLFEVDDDGRRLPLDGPVVRSERTSTSALTRPLLQDAVFAPDVFVGGPAEVAYYAQIAPLHDLLGVALPRVALRGHALVAPQRIGQLIQRHEVEDIFAGPDGILARREGEAVERIEGIAAEARKELMEKIAAIADLALPADRSLAHSFERTIGHLDYHFQKLAERGVRALVRKDRERYQALRRIAAALNPDGSVQDRVVAWIPYWTRYGDQLTSRLVEEIVPDGDVCKVVFL